MFLSNWRPLAWIGRSLKRLALISTIFAAAIPASAEAIVGGQSDGNAHPNVGLLAGYDAEGTLYYTCSGTLVSPTVFLTAAHCLPGPEVGQPAELRVSFDETFPLGMDELGFFPIIDTFLGGVPHSNPAHDGNAPFGPAYVSTDIGVIVLDQPAAAVFPGVAPAPLPPAGYLASLPGADKRSFDVVGYGDQGVIRPQKPDFFIDYTRRNASQKFKKLYAPSAFSLRGSPNSAPATGSGTSCSGDSGGAVFDGALLTGVISGADFCKHETYASRLDTPSARSFLDDFVILP